MPSGILTGKVTVKHMLTNEQRRKRFRGALALAGLTLGQWAEKEGVTYGHLYHVLSGRRESVSLLAKVDTFCAIHLDRGPTASVA